MPVLVVYILKLSIGLAVVYMFYHFVLRKLTFYSWNRWYLLGYSFSSFFIAFSNIAPLFQTSLQHYNRAMQLVPAIDFSKNISGGQNAADIIPGGWNNWTWFLCVVVAGAIVLSIRLIMQYFSFLRIRSKAELLSENETRVYHVEADIIPFSFGNSIFINKQLHSLDELQEIVRHEFVHVKQKHSIDILWSELLCIVSWYNPFAWLLKRSIRQNLEFIADSKVLESGMNKKEYQYLLLKVIGNNHFSIASKFNFSSLKKRIAMMNKMKTARVHIVKFLFILPLVAVLLIAFRKKEHETNPGRSQLASEPKEITFSSLHVTYDSDTTPKAKADRREMDDRGIDQFEITDKKAMIRLRNGKTEEYDITDSSQRRIFEKKYGKIISLDDDTGEPAPVTVVSTSIEAAGLSQSSVTAAPLIVTTSGETVIAASPVKTVSSAATPVTVSLSPLKTVSVVDDDVEPLIAPEDVLATITKKTSAAELEDFQKQLKEKGYQLSFDKTTYSAQGTLTHVSGTIKSPDGKTGNFSATDFERVTFARIKYDHGSYLRIDIVDKKKHVI
jgi:bla regulator protein blaR1